MPKKLLYLIIGTFIVLLIGVFVYYYFFTGEPPAKPINNDDGNSIFPKGDNNNALPPKTDDNNLNANNNDGSTEKKFRLVSTKMSAGAQMVDKNGELAIRFVDKTNGNVYDLETDEWKEVRVSNKTIPRIHEALFDESGKRIVMRYTREGSDQIENYIGVLETNKATSTNPEEQTEFDMKGSFLPRNILSLAIVPKSGKSENKIIYSLRENGTTAIIMTDFDSKKTEEIWRSPLKELNIFSPSATTTIISTKSDSSALGYAYAINNVDKSFKKILGGIPGLSILPQKDASTILYNRSKLRTFDTLIFEKNQSGIIRIQTLAEKCVWSKNIPVIYCAVPKEIKNGAYPEEWYRGEISFEDEIWKINVDTGTADLLYDPGERGVSIDGVKLQVDNQDKLLIIEDNTSSLIWALEL